MRKPPIQIATPNSAADVTGEIKKLLRAADVGSQLPTPKAAILACARLVESGELDLEEYRSTIVDKSLRIFHRAIGKVLGFLDRRSHVVYVDPSILDSRKLFVTYHEVTHKILPWQHIVYTEEEESTLSKACKDIFESEANYGAAEVLFQCERFELQARDHELSIASALYIGNQYDASCHAALRRFVERNHRPCLLLILKATALENADGKISYCLTYSISSPSFTSEFGAPLDVTFINPNHELGMILNGGGSGEITLRDIKGFPKRCIVETFSNQFRQFVLVHPRRSRRVHFRARFESRSL